MARGRGRPAISRHHFLSYAEQTHGSRFWIVRYAHERRAAVAAEMILHTKPAVVIDWGTGDGFVIEGLLDRADTSLELMIAYEPGVEMARLLRDRLGAHRLGDRVRVCDTPSAVIEALDGRLIDVFACLGVLEHLPLTTRRVYYRVAAKYLAPEGCLIIDVPVEYGPALLVKELARRFLKGRPPAYPLRELLLRSIGRTTRDPARFDDTGSTRFITTHRGFDHRHLIDEVSTDYRVVERRNTPVRWAPAWAFNQEVIFRAVSR